MTRQDTVCDNTRDMALASEGAAFKVRHSRWSGYKIGNAREALQIIHTMSEQFQKEIKELCEWQVSDADFEKHTQLMIPINDELSKAGITKAENKRGEIINLYRNDLRVAPWNGTAYGVSQAYNTWRHHFATVKKGVPRAVRNMENVITGKMGVEDKLVLDTLRAVQA